MKNKTLALFVLTWNDWKNTISCLESVFKNNYNKFDVFLIDNNSTEENINKIIEWSKKKNIIVNTINNNFFTKKIGKKNFYFLKLKEIPKGVRFAINAGATAAYNRGIKIALRCNYDFVMKVDCDFILPHNLIKGMIETLQANNTYASVSPKVLYWIRKKTKLIWWKNFNLSRNYVRFQQTGGMDRRTLDSANFKNIILTDAVCGACVMYRANILKKIGLPDEEFFFGPEDIEISQRIRKSGSLLAVNLNYRAYHKVSQSIYVSGIKSRIYFETIGWLVLIKKISNSTDKFLGYSFFLLRTIIHMFKIIFKQDNQRHIGFVLGVKDFMFNKHLSK
jgi:GT2 family glycosyltransferase